MKRGTVQNLFLGSMTGAAMLFAAAGTAQAVEFKFGEATLLVDNTASIGIGVRASGQNCQNVNTANGGCTVDNGSTTGISFGVNDDDGNVNTDRGDIYSTPVKLTTDFELRYQNFGAFVRTKVFYDYWVNEELGDSNGRFGKRPITDGRRGDKARKFGGRGADILDAFVFANFDVGGNPVTLRAGKQVINWGESLFIQGGVSSYLPVDVSALRTPGSELKEAYLPVPAVYASIALPGAISVEAFWQFDWKRTRLDACGTFFSGTDAACEGGAYVMNAGEYPTAPILIPRQESDEGDDTGTFGVAFKHYATWLNNGTDLGFYYVRQSLTAPIGTFTLGDFSAGTAGLPGGPYPNAGALCAAAIPGFNPLTDVPACLANPLFLGGFVGAANTKTYLTQYVNDVDSFGFSFNTSIPLLGGSALSGELNYTPDMPFALNDVSINCQDLEASGIQALFGLARACRPDAPTGYAPGDTIQGYDYEKSLTGQIGMISTLSGSNPVVDVFGGDILILVANAGFQYIPDLDSVNNRYAIPRSAISNPNLATNTILGNDGCKASNGGYCEPTFADSFSWGYRLATSVDYNNAFGTAWTVSPSIQWAHDVSGYSAGPIGPGFVEGKKTISLGVTAALQSTWRASIQYTNSFGNEFRNFSADKDFTTMTVSYAF